MDEKSKRTLQYEKHQRGAQRRAEEAKHGHSSHAKNKLKAKEIWR